MRILVTLLLVATIAASGTSPVRAQADSSLEDRIREAVLLQMEERLPGSARSLEIRIEQLEPPSAKVDSLRVALGSARIPRGRHQVDLEVRTGSGPTESWQPSGWALLHVAHYDSVVVAREALSPGQAVEPRSVETVWMDVTDVRGLPLSAGALRNARGSGRTVMNRSVQRGELLQADDLRGSYAADTGDQLLLRYERGPVQARLDCRARQPGSQGEIIRVYCGSTRSTYRARLTGGGEATWVTTVR